MGSLSKLIFAVSICILFGGCVKEQIVDETIVLTFEFWVAILVFLGAVGLTALGWFLRNSNRFGNWGWGLLIVAPLLAVVMAPGLMLDKVTINSEQFTLRTGFWFAQTKHDVRFGDLQRIELAEEVRRGRRGKQVDVDLVCHLKSGSTQRVPVGTLMQYAVEKILIEARNQNIPVR